ncbi:hypothetical protein Scep_010463 [Stephania cephalantha]|uniref:Uncharacterized protein n=1 Tax=Stephania cephalantha TaxID=152367 RepID=A0AAP0PE56_9MAGN
MVDKGKVKREEGIIGSGGKELMLLPSSHASSGSSYKTPLPVRQVQPSSNNCSYPSPVASYEAVVANPQLFRESLEKLHHQMSTKFMIPIIGGKDLDLHRLFLEVTSRGGIEKILKERRWKEVTAVFNFPSTATNASFILRKYYFSLIYHYEQIYFFGAQYLSHSSAEMLSSPTPIAPKASGDSVTPLEAQFSTAHKRSRVNASLGSPVIGVIDGKFEHGYLVSVTVGTEKLKGILYHPFDPRTGQVSPYFGNIPNNVKDSGNPGVRRRRRRKKCEIKRRDPDHPKPNRSGYNFFFAEQHAKLKPLHPGKDRDISKMIGERWNNLNETDKAVYQEKGVKDKERYRSEMEEYRERLRTGYIISNAVPIQQRQATPEVNMVDASHELESDIVEEDLETEADTIEVDTEMGADEGDSHDVLENGSSSGGYGSEEKTAERDSEMEVSIDVGNDAESGKAASDKAAEGKSFELRKRDRNYADESGVETSKLENTEEEDSRKELSIDEN